MMMVLFISRLIADERVICGLKTNLVPATKGFTPVRDRTSIESFRNWRAKEIGSVER